MTPLCLPYMFHVKHKTSSAEQGSRAAMLSSIQPSLDALILSTPGETAGGDGYRDLAEKSRVIAHLERPAIGAINSG